MTLLNADFKQIEVCVLAQLSKDSGFIQLLKNNIDIYKYFAAIMYNKSEDSVTVEERNSLKVPILGISYGKGYKKLSMETGKSEEWCSEFINNFYEQFPKVKQLHKNWLESVNRNRELPVFSGVRLKFKYYEKTYNEDYDCWFKAGYKPTEIKNYPVQHTAFVIFSLYLSLFWREKVIKNRDKYLLINTVHDSIMLDCKPEYIKTAKKDIQEVLDILPDNMLKYYGEKLEIPLKVDISTGHSWYEF